MWTLISKKTLIITLAVIVLAGGSVTYFAVRGQGTTAALPDGAIPIPADLIQKYEQNTGEPFDKFTQDVEAIQERAKKIGPYQEQLFRLALDRAGVAPNKFIEFKLDAKKRAIVKAEPPKQ